MDQPRRSRRIQGSGVDNSWWVEHRAAVAARMLAGNREGLGMKVIAVMVQRYGVLPSELWDLNSISDMGAGRGITYDKNVSQEMLESIIGNARYSILDLTIKKNVYRVSLPDTLRRLHILVRNYSFPLHPLPASLKELVFSADCEFNGPLELPNKLRVLKLGSCYKLPVTLPPELRVLRLGAECNHIIFGLPQTLRWLDFPCESEFNLPVSLPPRLKAIYFGNHYNQATILPSGIVEIGVGPAFAHDLSFSDSIRKIVWCCNRAIQIPKGVLEIYLGSDFNQPVTFPASLKNCTFAGDTYSHPLSLPLNLEELAYYPKQGAAVVLPGSLLKLTWASPCAVQLPVGLKELVLRQPAPLALPEGLCTVHFDCYSSLRYDLPESVQEVIMSRKYTAFTHPATLQHLIIQCGSSTREYSLSHLKVHKLTIGDASIRITEWPQELKLIEFTVVDMDHSMRVPKGVRRVGGPRPARVVFEDALSTRTGAYALLISVF